MILLKPWLRRHAFKLVILFFGVLVPLYGFGTLAEDVVKKEVFPFDKTILLFAHAHATPLYDAILIFFTRAGSAKFILPFNILVFVVLMMRPDRRRATFWLMATGGAALLNLLAKQVFSRVRPDLWISLLPETTFSFPSGHAMQSMAVGVALTALAWHGRWRWPTLAATLTFAVLVGFSRVYLGVHYPSDILAGWTASLAWVIGLASLFKVVWYSREDHAVVSAPPGPPLPESAQR